MLPFWNPELRIFLQLPRFVVQILTLGPKPLFCFVLFCFSTWKLSINVSPSPAPNHKNTNSNGETITLWTWKSQRKWKVGACSKLGLSSEGTGRMRPHSWRAAGQRRRCAGTPPDSPPPLSEMFPATPQSHLYLSWENDGLNGSDRAAQPGSGSRSPTPGFDFPRGGERRTWSQWDRRIRDSRGRSFALTEALPTDAGPLQHFVKLEKRLL